MNYQLLLECHAQGTQITRQEAELLDLELYSQIESIKVSRTQGCLQIAPDHICKISLVCNGSNWITCLAAVLDQLLPATIGKKARGAQVFDELVRNGYFQ
ncbi:MULTISPECIES: hypothetical protein [unclassified Prochlorococcus]|uniref:hypothetical protein n=1 Tax=unclassified Prochlorococcus TaxID=2627481 RepID=UPI000533891A|nr:MULTISPECIES: hypothetical protein [unclassified Prochlorococcus]KGG16099.1 hypothetical protein EV06_0807 [Prochlorococcus sp. MIT 0602]KGG17219.1 hypothetical protein EV07_0655 [Prochlorococcus sp. MIT 0603]